MSRGSIYLGIAGGFLVASGGMFGAYFVTEHRGQEAQAATNNAAATTGATLDVDAALGREVELVASSQKTKLRWSDLGAVVDDAEIGSARGAHEQLAAAGRIPLRIDRDKAAAALADVKARLDRAPVDAYLDLEGRKVRADEPGIGLDIYGSLPRLEAAVRSGATSVELAVVEVPARVTRTTLGIDDISTVLGTWTTKFSVADKGRNFNLKLAASKVNGFVMQPGVEFSFNTVVGDRTEKQGYKVAHVIQAGEMVDGMAGGSCQISTTLFVAAFFGGLEIVKQTPHSRPSVYAPLGLDATVTYPHTDLKLSNPFPFPVAIHYRVRIGEATVEILGKERPFDKAVFEREIIEETPFMSEERLDETLAEGASTIDQPGFNGYKIKRIRKLIKSGKVIDTDKWTLAYKPVTEYIRMGTSTDPEAKQPVEKDHHMPKVPKTLTWSTSQ